MVAGGSKGQRKGREVKKKGGTFQEEKEKEKEVREQEKVEETQ